MSDQVEEMGIGTLAARAGVATSTLRYYDELGLLVPAHREAGRRRYTEAALERLATIQLCRAVGFTLRETAALLDGHASGPHAWRSVAVAKRDELTARAAEIERARRLLSAALDCDCATLAGCPHTSRVSAAAGHADVGAQA